MELEKNNIHVKRKLIYMYLMPRMAFTSRFLLFRNEIFELNEISFG